MENKKLKGKWLMPLIFVIDISSLIVMMSILIVFILYLIGLFFEQCNC